MPVNKCRVRPMLSCKFRSARATIACNEIMHMTRKGQLGEFNDIASSALEQFNSLPF